MNHSHTHTHRPAVIISEGMWHARSHTHTLGAQTAKKTPTKYKPKKYTQKYGLKTKKYHDGVFFLPFLYDTDILRFVVISKGISHLIFWCDKERWKIITHYLKSSNGCPFLFLPNRLKLNVNNIKMIFSQLANHQLFLSWQIWATKKGRSTYIYAEKYEAGQILLLIFC